MAMLGRRHTPFSYPIAELGEHGAVLFPQGHDYKADDALALIEIANALPPEAARRVEYLPMTTQIPVFSLKAMARLLGEAPSQGRRDEGRRLAERWLGHAPDPKVETDQTVERLASLAAQHRAKLLKEVVNSPLPELPRAENLLIIGRPQYWALWWIELLGEDPRVQRASWLRRLVLGAGYSGRYWLPWEDDVQTAQPRRWSNAMFDRKWGLRYERGPGERPEEHDYGLLFHNRVVHDGITRRVTVCAGLSALGTWAACKLAVDPTLFGQLEGAERLELDEGPVEVAIKVDLSLAHHTPLIGRHNLDLQHITLLNPSRREHVGHYWTRKANPTEPARAVHRGEPFDLAKPVRALRRMLPADWLNEADPSCGELAQVVPDHGARDSQVAWPFGQTDREQVARGLEALEGAPIREAPLGTTPLDGDWAEDLWRGPGAAPEAFHRHLPALDWASESDLLTLTARNALLRTPFVKYDICLGPKLYAALWEGLAHVLCEVQTSRDGKVPAPVLLLGDSGSGKDPFCWALRAAWIGERTGWGGIQHFKHLTPALNTAGNADNIATVVRTELEPIRGRGGILFMDEFSDMKPPQQVSLLTLLQDGILHPELPDGERAHNCMVLAATSQPLRAQMEGPKPEFRKDLFYRFRVVEMEPLRDRLFDAALLLANLWIHERKDPQGTGALDITLGGLRLFLSCPFRGNVRELRSTWLPALEDSWRSACRKDPRQRALNARMVNGAMALGLHGDEIDRRMVHLERRTIRIRFAPERLEVRTLVDAVRGRGA